MQVAAWLARLGVFAIALVLVAGWFGALHPALDSFSHFRVQLLIGLGLAIGLAVIVRAGRVAITGAMIAIVTLYLSVPHLPTMGGAASTAASIKLLQFNVYFKNRDLALAQETLAESPADFIVLQEVTARTSVVLEAVKASHPHQISCRFGGVGSVAIASRHPVTAGTKPDCARAYGFASARFDVNGKQITVASFHSYWPWPHRQPSQISVLAERFDGLSHPLILAGDFNAAPWSNATKRVAKLSGTRIAPGLVISWAPFLIDANALPFLGLAIDQTLYSPELSLLSRRALQQAGSDHLPIVSEFSWNE